MFHVVDCETNKNSAETTVPRTSKISPETTEYATFPSLKAQHHSLNTIIHPEAIYPLTFHLPTATILTRILPSRSLPHQIHSRQMLDKSQIVTADQGQLRHLEPQQIEENMRLIDDIKFFLATAPANWQKNQIIRRYYLNHDEGFVSCVYWNNLYFITGTDIVRCIVYRLEQFGREITDRKKFEEGIFSDLRSLKCGSDAVLEPSKSPFLDFLYKNSCLRTQKKQKVFFWFSVPHDKLFADALERDLKKEQVNQPATTRARQEPALSFQYNENAPLHEQLLQYVETHKPETVDDDNATVTPNTNNDYSSTPPTLPEEAQGEEPALEQHTFIIKEEPETGTPVVTPGRLDDDFPLDYFPQSSGEQMLIDPAVFMNPPDHFDGQFLIDQTYDKTPFYETFEAALIKREDTVDEDDLVVPVSQTPVGYMASHSVLQTPIVMGPNGGYYIPQTLVTPIMGGSQITNGQFYDQQLDGEDYAYELQEQHQYYYPQVYYPVAQDPSHPHAPQFVQVTQPPPAFFGETDESQQHAQYYDSHEHAGSIMSPFARVFPSFQATAPPSATSSQHSHYQQTPTSATSSSQRPLSAKSVRFPRFPATTLKPPPPGRVMKPSTLRQQRSVSNLKDHAEKIMRDVEKDEKKKEKEQEKSDDQLDDVEEEVVEEPATGPQDGKDNEGEYTTLPTPESTVQDREAQQTGAMITGYLAEE